MKHIVIMQRCMLIKFQLIKFSVFWIKIESIISHIFYSVDKIGFIASHQYACFDFLFP